MKPDRTLYCIEVQTELDGQNFTLALLESKPTEESATEILKNDGASFNPDYEKMTIYEPAILNEFAGKMEAVTISQADYNRLQKDSLKLALLEAGGVDNWEWYGDALEEFDNECKNNQL